MLVNVGYFTSHLIWNGNHSTYQNADDWGMVQIALF
jgi:hypothetical protein